MGAQQEKQGAFALPALARKMRTLLHSPENVKTLTHEHESSEFCRNHQSLVIAATSELLRIGVDAPGEIMYR